VLEHHQLDAESLSRAVLARMRTRAVTA